MFNAKGAKASIALGATLIALAGTSWAVSPGGTAFGIDGAGVARIDGAGVAGIE